MKVGEMEASLELDIAEYEKSMGRAIELMEEFTKKVETAREALGLFREELKSVEVSG